MKTYQPKGKEIVRKWHLFDADGQVLGRLSTQIATILMGKHKPGYAPHMDSGDYVVVLNCEKVFLSGKKPAQKVYYRHSGYLGSLKKISFQKLIKEQPDRVIINAVDGMLPDNRLKDKRLARLKVVKGDKNPYADKFDKIKDK